MKEREEQDDIFRPEAEASFSNGQREESVVELQLDSAWTGWGFWILLATAMLLLVVAWPSIVTLLPGAGE